MTDTNWQELAYTLFEEAGDALFLFDPKTELLHDVNPMAQRLTGFGRRDLLALKISYLFRSEANGGMERLRQAFRRTGLFHSQEGFWLRQRKEGSWIAVNLTITRLHSEPQILGLITARDISERRKAHSLLKQAEEELRRVTNSISDCLWSAETDRLKYWTYRYFSPVVSQITGRPPEYYLGNPERWLAAVSSDDRPRVENAYQSLREGNSMQVEYRIVWPDSSVRWVRDSVQATVDGESPLVLLHGVVSDITERKRSEGALRKSEARQRLLIEQIPAVVWTTDHESRFTSSVGAALSGLGLEPDQVVGMTLADYFESDEINNLPLAAHRKALEGESITYEMEWKGHTFHSHVEPLYDVDGKCTGTIGVALDITERKSAEDAIRKINVFLDSILENIPNMLFVKDAHTLRFARINKAGEELLGTTRAELIGKNDYDIFRKEEAEFFIEKDLEVLSNRKLVDISEEIVRTPFGDRILHTKKIPLLDEKGNPKHLLGISEDITERKHLEERVRQAQKMEAVGRLAGGVAHDFNNLLTAILGNLDLVLAELPEHHPSRELLSNASQAGFRAAELTRQLLSFARQGKLRPQSLNLNYSVEETVRLFQRIMDPRIKIELNLDPNLWKVHADATQISQVFMNLCLNGRDAMPDGGTLLVETANVSLGFKEARLRFGGHAGDFVFFRVKDTGQGMPPEVREHIFEPFFTTKEQGKGTGLGLAMVFGVVKQHGGWIECHSEPGQGSRFEVFLPCEARPSLLAEIPAAPPEVRGGTETVLLADDQEMIRRLGKHILERHGYRVFIARDGEDALNTFLQHKNEIQLVILDLSMPKLAGSDAYREMRKLNPKLQAIISSGYFTDQAVQALENQGIREFVSKPYRPLELAKRVRAVLDLAQLVSKETDSLANEKPGL